MFDRFAFGQRQLLLLTCSRYGGICKESPTGTESALNLDPVSREELSFKKMNSIGKLVWATTDCYP